MGGGGPVQSALRLLLPYPRFLPGSELPGPYARVGSLVRTRLDDTCCAATISFPAEAGARGRVSYWSPEAVATACNGYQLEGTAADGLLHLINSGPAALDGTGQQRDQNGTPTMKPFWEITDDEMAECLKATTWHPSITEYFPGGGLSTRYRTLGNMPATMTRINLVAGLGPALQIAEGETVGLPDSVHDVLDQRTNPTWPTTWFAPKITGRGAFTSTYEVMNHWGANHCVMTAGHVGHLFITLASILRIPVYMHNVSDDRVFRPSAWNAFGTDGLEGADFRACETFGPLYARA